MTTRTVSIEYPRISGATGIEQILCLATLMAAGRIGPASNLDTARDYVKIHFPAGEWIDCDLCPCIDRCLACIINE